MVSGVLNNAEEREGWVTGDRKPRYRQVSCLYIHGAAQRLEPKDTVSEGEAAAGNGTQRRTGLG